MPRVAVSCPVFLLTMAMVDCPVVSRLFRAPAECYPAFVEIVSSGLSRVRRHRIFNIQGQGVAAVSQLSFCHRAKPSLA